MLLNFCQLVSMVTYIPISLLYGTSWHARYGFPARHGYAVACYTQPASFLDAFCVFYLVACFVSHSSGSYPVR